MVTRFATVPWPDLFEGPKGDLSTEASPFELRACRECAQLIYTCIHTYTGVASIASDQGVTNWFFL